MDRIRLGDIATLINGDRGKNYPSQADITDEGDIPFVNAGHLNGRSIDFEEMNYISQDKFNRLSSGKFMKGDVLYCLRGSLGKKAIVNDDVEGAIASSLVIIRPDYNRIDGDYLMFSLDSPSIKEQLIKANNGSSQPNLSAASVREYQIELPDMKVQKDVVKKLAKVRTIIDSRQHEIDLLDELIKARFVEMFGNPLDKSKANRFFIECVDFNPKKSELDDLDIDVSFVPMECVGVDGSFTIKESGKAGDYYKGYTYFRDGDVLLAKITPCFENGKVAIAEGCENGIGFGTTEFHVSRPKPGVSNSYWIKYMLKNDFVHDLATINMTGSAGQKRIQTPFFEKLKVYLPPIEQQDQFADFTKQIDKSKVVA